MNKAECKSALRDLVRLSRAYSNGRLPKLIDASYVAYVSAGSKSRTTHHHYPLIKLGADK